MTQVAEAPGTFGQLCGIETPTPTMLRTAPKWLKFLLACLLCLLLAAVVGWLIQTFTNRTLLRT
ncbi:MAG: hypothetical protein ACK4Q5_14785 [Saprospiraceae bacterium]